MSSSESPADLVDATSRSPLIRLLIAMSAEWTEIAGQIQTLGDAVSSGASAGEPVGTASQLQAFDLIHQRAQGQANLLSRLSRKLADDQFFDRKRLGELIEDIPFHSVRAGLEAAFNGQHAAPNEKTGDDVEWL